MATFELPLTGPPAGSAADLSLRENQERLSAPAIAAFFKLAATWRLRDDASRRLMGGVSNGVFYRMKRGQARRRRGRPLDQDKLTRISLLLGIFKALNVLYRKELADDWPRLANSNPLFAGAAPIEYMAAGGVPAMMRVRQLLDGRRGGQ